MKRERIKDVFSALAEKEAEIFRLRSDLFQKQIWLEKAEHEKLVLLNEIRMDLEKNAEKPPVPASAPKSKSVADDDDDDDD